MSRAAGAPFVADSDSVRLIVRVTPRAKRSAFAGLVDVGEGRCAVAIRLAAPPVDGAANAALIAFLSKALGVGRSSLRIVAGEKARLKTVAIAGLALSDLAERLGPASAHALTLPPLRGGSLPLP